MPVKSALESSGKFLRESASRATLQLHESPTAPTARDYSTSALGGAFAVLVVTGLHHGVQVDLSPEAVAALTTVFGFLLARLFRY